MNCTSIEKGVFDISNKNEFYVRLTRLEWGWRIPLASGHPVTTSGGQEREKLGSLTAL